MYLPLLFSVVENLLEPVKPQLVHDNLLGEVPGELEVARPVEVEDTLKHLSVPVYEELIVPWVQWDQHWEFGDVN